MRRHPLSFCLSRAGIFLIALCLLAPIVVVLVISFSADSYLRFPPSSFSLRWYQRFLGDQRWRDAMVNSAVIGVMASLISTTIGFFAAYALLRARHGIVRGLEPVFLLPLIVPHVITAIGLYFVSGKLDLIGNRAWVAAAHSVLAIPVAYIIQQSALKAMDPALERAAMVFGCSRLQVLRRVTLPLAFPAIASAALFSFLTSFDEVVVTLFLAGVKAQTLPVRIWNSLVLEVEPTIAAVSSLFIAVTFLVLMLNRALRITRS